MPPVWRLQPPGYNFGVFTLQPLQCYSLIQLRANHQTNVKEAGHGLSSIVFYYQCGYA